jgi:hypothetical protein
VAPSIFSVAIDRDDFLAPCSQPSPPLAFFPQGATVAGQQQWHRRRRSKWPR